MAKQRIGAAKIPFNLTPGGELHLDLCAESQVAGIAQSRHDITFGGEFIVDGPAPDLTAGFATKDVFYAHGAGDGNHYMDLGGMAFLAEELNGLHQGGSCSQHGV